MSFLAFTIVSTVLAGVTFIARIIYDICYLICYLIPLIPLYCFAVTSVI